MIQERVQTEASRTEGLLILDLLKKFMDIGSSISSWTTEKSSFFNGFIYAVMLWHEAAIENK